jgi:hypothetical protein
MNGKVVMLESVGLYYMFVLKALLSKLMLALNDVGSAGSPSASGAATGNS